MATRSNIGIVRDDGTVTSVYCHWDGYPSHVGVVLHESYETIEKAAHLLSHGSISVLGREIGETQDFDGPRENRDWSMFYHRDRGEELTIDQSANIEEYSKLCSGDYAYLFENGKWHVWSTYSDDYTKRKTVIDYFEDKFVLLSIYDSEKGFRVDIDHDDEKAFPRQPTRGEVRRFFKDRGGVDISLRMNIVYISRALAISLHDQYGDDVVEFMAPD